MIQPQDQNIEYAIADLAAASITFNNIAGKGGNFSKEAIDNQIELINEEVKELNDAFTANDAVELLDAVIDIYVVLTGLAQQLQSAGMLVGTAAELVAENNLSKFPKELMVAEATVVDYKTKGINTTIDFNHEHGVYVIKDTASKVRKPVTFKSVDLTECVPAGLIINGFIKEQ